MKTHQAKYRGSCLCGKVRYEVTEFEAKIAHCHCKMCQKFHGAAFSTFGEVKLKNLHWITGYDHLKSYQASNNTIRKFCNTCGSSLVFCSPYNQKDGTVELAISTLDDSRGLIPDAHIYTSSKVPWLTIDDGLKKYTEYRENENEA